jgi:hypothetical protein
VTAPRKVVLLTRNGCGLCDDAAVELRRLSDVFGFSFTEKDIDSEPGLRERYNDLIPVVLADGREIARAPLAADDLQELLVGASV